MRWRLTRLAQRRIPAAGSLLELPDSRIIESPVLEGGGDAIRAVVEPYAGVLSDAAALRRYLSTGEADAPVPADARLDAVAGGVFAALLQLDRWLAATGPQPPAVPPFTVPCVADLEQEIADLGLDSASVAWRNFRQILADWYYLALVLGALGAGFALIEVLGLLTRWLLVIGLVDEVQQAPSPIKTPDDVYAALHWRTPVLPDVVAAVLVLIRNLRRAAVVRKPGFADLYVTREEWDHYEAAEIASIENILAGELKKRVHVLVNQTSVTTTTEQVTSTLKEQDTTTTDLSQLQQQSSSDISIAAHIDGQVDTTGQYGPTQVSTHLGGSLDLSYASATSKATTQSHETVARAVTQIEQTTRQVRTVSTLTRATDTEEHKFDNTKAKAKLVVGIYRWVDQIQNVELDRYPHRFLMEFEIPEPGAWTRRLLTQDAGQNMINQPPMPLTINGQPVTSDNPALSAADLSLDSENAAYYADIAVRYLATGISPPPGPLTVAVNINSATDDGEAKRFEVLNATETTLAVPKGYQVSPALKDTDYNWAASLLYAHGGYGDKYTDIHIDVSVGGGWPVRSAGQDANPAGKAVLTPGGQYPDRIEGTAGPGAAAGPISQGEIPVTLQGTNLTGFEVNVEVLCVPTAETIQQWQNNTYDAIVAAYNSLLQAYLQEKAGLTLQQTNPVDTNSPEQNAETITQELKRQTIEMLLGNPFSGLNDIDYPGKGSGPTICLAKAVADAPEVQFLEEAFEWETMSYICYPYYWADATRWKDLAVIAGDDSNFADFLRAGSARVVLAARPGFEDQVNFYIYTGIPWGAGPMPAPGDENYLSIADEIKAAQQRPIDVTVIDTWQVRLPTTLIWLENKAGLPRNEDPTIDTTPKIVSLSAASGAPGDPITIMGRNFGDIQGNSTATFYDLVKAVPSRWSTSSIDVVVPDGATTGSVTVTVNGVVSNGVDFEVT
jgi:hypothetical protein